MSPCSPSNEIQNPRTCLAHGKGARQSSLVCCLPICTKMNTQHIKTFYTDDSGTSRLRFASTKKRSQQASADVYRKHKRRSTGIATSHREEAVHHESQAPKRNKNKKSNV